MRISPFNFASINIETYIYIVYIVDNCIYDIGSYIVTLHLQKFMFFIIAYVEFIDIIIISIFIGLFEINLDLKKILQISHLGY